MCADSIEELERKNAELRRMCRNLYIMLGADRCNMCGEPCVRLCEEPPVCELEERLARMGVDIACLRNWRYAPSNVRPVYMPEDGWWFE